MAWIFWHWCVSFNWHLSHCLQFFLTKKILSQAQLLLQLNFIYKYINHRGTFIIQPPTHHRRISYLISLKSGQHVGRQSVDSWPSVGRLSADCRPTAGRLSTDALADVSTDASVGSDSLPLPSKERSRAKHHHQAWVWPSLTSGMSCVVHS